VNLSSLVRTVRDLLEAAGVPSPEVDAELLISHVLGMRRTEIYLEPERPVDAAAEAGLLALAAERARRVPLQYLIGQCEFMSLPFKVQSGVFIPRPETEILVDAIAERVGGPDRGRTRILDVGTGSGVVGVALAGRVRPDLVLCCDVSAVAVEIARENAILNGVEDVMLFAVGDGTGFLGPVSESAPGRGFDVLACNPPYVATGDIPGLEPEVRDFDPRAALDGGEDGLRFIAGMLPGVPSIIRKGGLVGLEIGADEARAVLDICRRAGLEDLEVIRDLNGRDRVIIGRVA
jgi:release factor glutamine methyltransferase